MICNIRIFKDSFLCLDLCVQYRLMLIKLVLPCDAIWGHGTWMLVTTSYHVWNCIFTYHTLREKRWCYVLQLIGLFTFLYLKLYNIDRNSMIIGLHNHLRCRLYIDVHSQCTGHWGTIVFVRHRRLQERNSVIVHVLYGITFLSPWLYNVERNSILGRLSQPCKVSFIHHYKLTITGHWAQLFPYIRHQRQWQGRYTQIAKFIGPTDGPHVGPMNPAIRDSVILYF